MVHKMQKAKVGFIGIFAKAEKNLVKEKGGSSPPLRHVLANQSLLPCLRPHVILNFAHEHERTTSRKKLTFAGTPGTAGCFVGEHR